MGKTGTQRTVLQWPAGRVLSLLVLGTTTTALAVHFLKPGIVDDGYIFFRYAENLANGLGPIFNPGERVEGFSSPLWTLTLAVCAVVISDLKIAASLLGYFCALGFVAIVNAGLRTRKADEIRRDVASIPILLLVLPPVIYYCFSGMDQPLFALIVTAAIVSSIADRDLEGPSRRTFALLVLATFARPEGLLASMLIFARILLRNRSSTEPRSTLKLARSLALYALVLAAMMGARLLFFGELLPNTFYVKVSSQLIPRFLQGGRYLFRAGVAFSPLILLCTTAWAVIRVRRVPPPPGVSLLAGWIFLYGSYVIFVGGDHFPMFRFVLPVIPALVLLSGLLWPRALSGLSGSVSAGLRIVLPAAIICAAALCQTMEGDRARRMSLLAEKWADRGRWIADHTPANTVLATTSIGGIGYYSGRTVVDMLGLTDATVSQQGDIYPGAAHGHARFHTDYIFQREPDLVIYYRTIPPEQLQRVLTPPELINKTYAYALYDFVSDPRCAERYDQVLYYLEDGGVIEMQKKRGFSFLP